jgi:hypothetical protein
MPAEIRRIERGKIVLLSISVDPRWTHDDHALGVDSFVRHWPPRLIQCLLSATRQHFFISSNKTEGYLAPVRKFFWRRNIRQLNDPERCSVLSRNASRHRRPLFLIGWNPSIKLWNHSWMAESCAIQPLGWKSK